MKFNPNPKLWIGAASLLLMQLVLPISAEAHHFSCQASALRLNLLNAVVVDPVVANPADDPCQTDSRSLLSINGLLGISAGVVSAQTHSAPNPGPVWAKADVANLKLLNVLGLVNATAGALEADAKATPVGGICVLSGYSTVAKANILGRRIDALSTFLHLPVLNVLGLHIADLYLNATLGGPHPNVGSPDPNKIIQRRCGSMSTVHWDCLDKWRTWSRERP
jgi:hypothetical protein